MPEPIEITNAAEIRGIDTKCAGSLQTMYVICQRAGLRVLRVWHLTRRVGGDLYYAEVKGD